MCVICDFFAGKTPTASTVCAPCRDAAQDQANWAWLPKVHLHIHLEGALRLQTVIELAEKHGLEETAAADDPRGYYLTAEPFENLSALLDRFGRSQRVLRDLADALRESRAPGPAPEVHVTVAAPRLADVVLAAAVASAVSCGVCATFFFLVVAPRL